MGVCSSTAYLVLLLAAALTAAAPAVVDVVFTCDVAIVSGTVTSHVRHLPYDHGRSVTPSGHFPSLLVKPSGFFEDDIWARQRLRQMMSFN